MKIRFTAFLAALAVAGLFTLPAFAGDGEKEKPSGGAKEAPKGEVKDKDGAGIDKGGCCKEAEKACGDCAEGAKEGCAECCKGKTARSDLEIVTLAVVEGTCDAAKKVLAAVPAAAVEKVEAARKVAVEKLTAIHASMADLKKDFEEACAEAKAKGAEVCCDMKATFESDMKALHAKAKEQIELCAKTVKESIGEEKVKELSADCRKAGDMAKAAGERIKAAAAKLLEKKKLVEVEEVEGDAAGGKCEEKGPEKEAKDQPEPKGKK